MQDEWDQDQDDEADVPAGEPLDEATIVEDLRRSLETILRHREASETLREQMVRELARVFDDLDDMEDERPALAAKYDDMQRVKVDLAAWCACVAEKGSWLVEMAEVGTNEMRLMIQNVTQPEGIQLRLATKAVQMMTCSSSMMAKSCRGACNQSPVTRLMTARSLSMR